MKDLLHHPHPLRKWYVAVVLVWIAMAPLLWGRLAQDAVPYLVAGELAHDQPGEVYASESGDIYDLRPTFATEACRVAPSGTSCADVNVAYVSMPIALPFAVVLAVPSAEVGVLLARLLAAAALAVGMLALWNRLAPRAPEAPRLLVATAVLLTPMAIVPITLGQTSPYLFALAALGVSRTDRARRGAATAALWALTIGLKLFPAGMALVLLVQRRFRLLLWTALALAGLALLTLLVAPASIWSDFVEMSRRVADRSVGNPYSGSLDNLAHLTWSGLTGNTALSAALLGVRAVAAGGLWWWGVRDADDDTQWAYGWLALLLVVPLVWWHYLWVAVAALGLTLAQRSIDRRWLVALPVLAALTVPISLVDATSSGSWPAAQALFLVGVAVAVPVIARRGRRPAAVVA